ncbi:hypothetical protein J7J83_03990 [bacterium]|nr:hypothetical protein [bacterium]
MNRYKIQFHCHSGSDPDDFIFHSDKDVIDKAVHYNYDVLALTCHNKIVHTQELAEYAKKKGLLLIPGIEKTIEGKHVVIINASKEAEFLQTFEDLEFYKKNHIDSLIFAPHPYHPLPVGLVSLRHKLDENIHLFDAIEWSSFYTKHFKFNNKAKKKAEEMKLPMLGTSDNHVLRYLNYTYSVVKAPQKTTHDILNAVKKGNLEISTKPMNAILLIGMTGRLMFLEYIKKLYKFIFK